MMYMIMNVVIKYKMIKIYNINEIDIFQLLISINGFKILMLSRELLDFIYSDISIFLKYLVVMYLTIFFCILVYEVLFVVVVPLNVIKYDPS